MSRQIVTLDTQTDLPRLPKRKISPMKKIRVIPKVNKTKNGTLSSSVFVLR